MEEWISVKDGEPEEEDVYLITWVGEVLGTDTRPMIELAEYDGAGWCVDHIVRRGYKNVRVTGWMPCPDPYDGRW